MTLGESYRQAQNLYAELKEEAIHLAAERAQMCGIEGDGEGKRHWGTIGRFVAYLHTGKIGSDCAKFGT